MRSLVEIRRDLHRHPELAFEEFRTAELLENELRNLGLEVSTGLAGTGIVATLRGGPGPAIGLRADMDALQIEEENPLSYRSIHPGKMHACGHDGHMAMLLGAARALRGAEPLDGIVHFIFQPAEENEGGGRTMVEEGLFDHFPMTAVYGLHNWPGLAAGHFAIREGPIMAAYDTFEIVLQGTGAHAAMPHLGRDTVLAAAQLVGNLQGIAARALDPLTSGVVSITQLHGGDAYNVLPEQVLLRGCTRYFHDGDGRSIRESLERMSHHVAAAHGVSASLHYERRYPATKNSPSETRTAIAAATAVAGAEHVDRNIAPSMASEDFAFMLQQRPGAYIFLGNGPGEGGCLLHNPRYDFNDAVIDTGVRYWTQLVRTTLKACGQEHQTKKDKQALEP